jgi:bifunctional DNA-binding transcriptional regulator/antitoxin component of YhaV-PrlF toxin-antitoxin module
LRRLPLQCTGCGAFTQTADPDQAGYYNLGRKAVREYLGLSERRASKADVVSEEDRVVQEALKNLPTEELEALGLSADTLLTSEEAALSEAEGTSTLRSPSLLLGPRMPT